MPEDGVTWTQVMTVGLVVCFVWALDKINKKIAELEDKINLAESVRNP